MTSFGPSYATKPHGRLLATGLDDVWKLPREALREVRLAGTGIQPHIDSLGTERAFHYGRNGLEAHVRRFYITATAIRADLPHAIVVPSHGPEGHKHRNTEDALFVRRQLDKRHCPTRHLAV